MPVSSLAATNESKVRAICRKSFAHFNGTGTNVTLYFCYFHGIRNETLMSYGASLPR